MLENVYHHYLNHHQVLSSFVIILLKVNLYVWSFINILEEVLSPKNTCTYIHSLAFWKFDIDKDPSVSNHTIIVNRSPLNTLVLDFLTLFKKVRLIWISFLTFLDNFEKRSERTLSAKSRGTKESACIVLSCLALTDLPLSETSRKAVLLEKHRIYQVRLQALSKDLFRSLRSRPLFSALTVDDICLFRQLHGIRGGGGGV